MRREGFVVATVTGIFDEAFFCLIWLALRAYRMDRLMGHNDEDGTFV